MSKAIKMPFMDDTMLDRRNMAIQEVINLTTVNGHDYLKKLEEFNRQFKPNKRVRILYHEMLQNNY